MNIIVTGGTGFVGSNLCRTLASRGHDVTALSRSASPAEVPDDVSVVTGDITDYESIVDVFEGRDAVVNLVALSPVFKPKGGNEAHERVHVGGTRNVVRAAEEQGLDALVQMSALGADPTAETAYIRAKGKAERVVTDSSLRWTIFRPSLFFGEGAEFIEFTALLTTPYLTALPGGGKTRFQPIWIEDFTPMMAEAAEDDSHGGEIYEIGGPEELTLAEVTEAIHAARGRPVTVLSVPMPLVRVVLELTDRVPLLPFGVDQYRYLSFDNTTQDNDIGAFGRSPADLQTLSAYLKENR